MPEVMSLSWVVEGLRSWSEGAALGFVALQVIQVLVFWLPGEVIQMAGGVLFGVVGGTALSLVGLSLGSLGAFLAARHGGRARVEAWLTRHGHGRFLEVLHHPRWEWLLAGIFFLPFLPKDIFCYLAGLARVRWLRFVAITTVARIPSLVLSTWMGDLALRGAEGWMVSVLVFTSLLGLALFLFRRSLMALLLRS